MAKKGLRAWVKEKWVDIGAPDGKGGYKPCGRQKGEISAELRQIGRAHV